MENQKEPVIGYPAADFFPPGYGAPVYTQPPTVAATAAATRTSTNPSMAQRANYVVRECVGPLFLFCMAILFFGILAFLWLHHPAPNFQISSLSVSPFDSSSAASSLQTANWNITFFIQNPNKKYSLSYEQVEVSVLYHGVSLSSASIPPFCQTERDKRFMEVSMAASSSSSGDNNIVRSINGDLLDGALKITVAVDGTVRANGKSGYEGNRVRMTVFCDNVMVGLYGNTSAGALVGGSSDCTTHIK